MLLRGKYVIEINVNIKSKLWVNLSSITPFCFPSFKKKVNYSRPHLLVYKHDLCRKSLCMALKGFFVYPDFSSIKILDSNY